MRPSFLHLILAIGLGLSACSRLFADPITTTRPSDLALEIEALRAIDDLQATSSQVDQLRDAAADLTPKTQPADIQAIDDAVAGDRADYVALLRLREALLRADPAKIQSSEKELADLEEQLKVNLSPRVIPAPPALRSAVKLVPQFSGPQIAAYLGQHSEEVSDPTEVLLAALAQCRGMSIRDFRQFNQDVTQQVSELVAGVDPKDGRALSTRISNLLKKTHQLSDDDFDAQRPDLEDQARDIATADSAAVLHHWMAREIAQLLSNPQLTAALDDRLSWAGDAAPVSEGEK